MVAEWPADKTIKIGQRWVREDPGVGNKCIIEITSTNGKSITGPMIQLIVGEKPIFIEDHEWCSDVISSWATYTYLAGQDLPKK